MNDLERQGKTRELTVIGFRASPDLVAQLDAVAAAEGLTLASVVRRAALLDMANRKPLQRPQEAA